MVLEDAHTFQLVRPRIVEGKADRDRNAFGNTSDATHRF
jgi:hypothetical protein